MRYIIGMNFWGQVAQAKSFKELFFYFSYSQIIDAILVHDIDKPSSKIGLACSFMRYSCLKVQAV